MTKAEAPPVQRVTDPFLVVVKSTTAAQVFTGRGFSKHAKRAQVFANGHDSYARIDAVALASGAYPGDSDALDTVLLEGQTPAEALVRYMTELHELYYGAKGK